MNIIVTGGNGYLGSNIVKKLIKENHNVLVLSKNNNNIQSILNHCQFISSYADELEINIDKIKLFSPDVILLFGWNGGNNHKDVNDTNQYHKNIPYYIKFLESISQFDKKPKIIGVGSFIEYGDYNIPIKEDFFESPKNLYGLCKLIFKQYSEMFCKQNGIDWAWIRPCYIYGLNDVKTRLIPTVIQKCLKNENIELDECNTIIDYLYIEDFVNYVYEIITSNKNEVYNICSGNQYHLKDVISIIHELTNSKSKIIFNSSLNRSKNNNYICGDNTKIKKISKKIELIDIKRGIKETIQFYDGK